LFPVSLVEVEVLETSGVLRKPCESCGATSQWSHAKNQIEMRERPGPEKDTQANAAFPSAMGNKRRRFGRVSLQLPVRICDYDGGVEITRSENLSKGGFCFVSEKRYQHGQGLLVICPYDSAGENIEVRARVVNCSETKGNRRKVYGVQFHESGH
jgi:hypothetical protein